MVSLFLYLTLLPQYVLAHRDRFERARGAAAGQKVDFKYLIIYSSLTPEPSQIDFCEFQVTSSSRIQTNPIAVNELCTDDR